MPAGHRGRGRTRGAGRHRRAGRCVRERRGRLRRPPRHPGRPAAGKRLALANKESLIAGGPVVQPGPGRRRAGELVPVDSEHCAVHQCLRAQDPEARRGRGCAASCSPPAEDRSGAAPGPSLSAVTVERRPGPPHVVDGPQDHRRLVHPHEQGPRGDRGPRAVRRRTTTASRWSSTRSRSCTRWSSSPTGPRSPSCRCPTCACPSPTPWPTPSGSGTAVRRHRLGRRSGRSLRAPGPRGLPLPGPGLRRRPGRRDRPGVAQRGQRGGRGGLPGRPSALDPDP